jgi:predicted RND superfamily exporter protein
MVLPDCKEPPQTYNRKYVFNYRLLITIFILITATALTGFLRLDIDTDIVRSLPTDKRVISDALDIFSKHPIHDQIAVDIGLNRADPELLVQCGKDLEEQLHNSGLFAEVGTAKISGLIPDLAMQVSRNLPLLFSAEELERDIAPRLKASSIQERFTQLLQKLSSLEGIGQARFMGADPLGFMEPVMARLTALAPVQDSSIYNGFILSADKRHILITARPHASSSNTASARQISTLLEDVADTIAQHYNNQTTTVILTPVGAYRAALDNEEIIRHDVNLALLLSTLGIALLLFIAFPRPLLGIFSLLPALAGTSTALLLYSLFHSSISIMVLGFGGAIISITVDHGIAYLLFLDRPTQTKGEEAALEIRSIGILAVLTTCGAFLTLNFSGFPVFVELGQFTAMGVALSFLFVHFVFPRLTPSIPPATKQRKLPLQRLVTLFSNTGKWGFAAATLLACGLLFFARPDFNVSLNSMNTVGAETKAADALFGEVWGDVSSRVILMITADSAAELQQKNDALLTKMEDDLQAEKIQSPFIPSMVFPGPARATANLTAWKTFWTPQRTTELQQHMRQAGDANGFSPQAFNSFLQLLDPGYTPEQSPLPARFYPLLGIQHEDGRLQQFINTVPGAQYNSQDFYQRYQMDAKIFDSPFFAQELGNILFESFATMLVIIAVAIVLLLLFFFASWQLTLITLLPPLFSYICTLGTMKLMGHPLDIPGLMLSIVILGMGIDYSIFFVRAQQRYRDARHPSSALVHMAVFMAGASTIIGFGVLCLAEHSLLRSIGITSLLGIGYSLLGTFLLLPPLLQSYFADNESGKKNGSIIQRVRSRYRLLEAYPRMFARFKLKSDPLFTDLPRFLERDRDRIRTILDIGCGYGVPGCWCLEYLPKASLFGIDPDRERVRVAKLAMGQRGEILADMAPELPPIPSPPDLILLLDMLHYLDDKSVLELFQRCYATMADQGLLLGRYVLRPETPSWSWKLEEYRVRLKGGTTCYRTKDTMVALLQEAGFAIEQSETSNSNSELAWLMGRASKK